MLYQNSVYKRLSYSTETMKRTMSVEILLTAVELYKKFNF